MKLKSLLFAILVLLIFSACTKENETSVTRSINNPTCILTSRTWINENANSIRETFNYNSALRIDSSIEKVNGEIQIRSIAEKHDKFQNISRSIKYYQGVKSEITTSKYIDYQKPVEIIKENLESGQVSREEYEYNNQNQLISEMKDFVDGVATNERKNFVYDFNGNNLSYERYRFGKLSQIQVFTYSSSNKLLTMSVVDLYTSDTTLYGKLYYDSNDLLTRTETLDNGIVINYEENTIHDAEGNLTHIERFGPSGTMIESFDYTYGCY